jgi:GNAT superfamily N-acetyltransferase/DNA-binding MarR family transcriptional regulator
MDDEAVAQVRRFNRTVTQRIGALEDAFLARSRPLGHSRVLWEIGAEGTDVRALRSRLDLDSGYLSRVLRALEAEGLVAVGASTVDGRVRVARLTRAGVRERAELDARSDEAAAAVLAGLGRSQQGRLVAAMAEVDRLLRASMVDVRPADPRDPDARACIAAYFAELARRFEGGFDPGRSLPAMDDELVPPAGLLLLARLHGEPVGCAALKLHGEQPAEVKRMWVADAVRGLGVGRRLLGAVEEHARASGVRTLRLETNRTLVEAIALYRSAGYREVPAFNDEPFADHWFEKHIGWTSSGMPLSSVAGVRDNGSRGGEARPRRAIVSSHVPTSGQEEAMTAPSREEQLRALYRAFNARDVDTVLAAMAEDVDWPNGWEGGRVVGHDAVRRYWERQWAQIRPHVEPTSIAERPDDTVEVGVHQVVRDRTGALLAVADVRHVYTFTGDLVQRMDVED